MTWGWIGGAFIVLWALAAIKAAVVTSPVWWLGAVPLTALAVCVVAAAAIELGSRS